MRKDTWCFIVNHRSGSINYLSTCYCYSIAQMNAEQTRQRIPKIPFRVLIIGRANAGKTSILQRVCETTESPIIYRKGEEGRKEVCGPRIFCGSDLTVNQVKLDPSVNVSNYVSLLRLLSLITEPAGRAQDR